MPDDALVAGYVGRYHHDHKGVNVLTGLAKVLPDPWHVVMVGVGVDGPALKASGRGVCNLHVLDADPATGDVMNAFDVLVVPSRYESFGLVMAEGLWAGVPIISTATGIARLVSGLTRTVPIGSGAEAWRDVILDDRQDVEGRRKRVHDGVVFRRVRLSQSRFGREWTALLLEVARDRTINRRVERPRGCGCAKRPKVTR